MNHESRQDLKHTFSSLVSTGANAGLNLAAGFLLAKGLPQHQYGLASSAIAISLVLQELVGRGINDSIIRLGVINSADSSNGMLEVFQAGLLIKFFMIMVTGLLLIIFGEILISFMENSEIKAGIPAVFFIAACYGLWTFLISVKQAEFRFIEMALIQPAASFIRLLFFVIFIYCGFFDWLKALWLTAAGLGISAFVFGFHNFRQVFSADWFTPGLSEKIRSVFSLSKWGILAGITYVGFSRMDIIMLTRFTDSRAVAVYNLAWQVLSVMDLVAVSIGAVMIPKISHFHFKKDLSDSAKRCLRLSLYASALCFPLFFSGKIIPVFFGEAYSGSADLISIMFAGNFVMCAVFPLIGIIYATGRFKYIASIQTALLVTSIPAYSFAALNYGVTGAAWMTLFLKTGMGILIAAGAFWSVQKAPVN